MKYHYIECGNIRVIKKQKIKNITLISHNFAILGTHVCSCPFFFILAK